MKVFLVWLIGHRNSLKISRGLFSNPNQKGFTILELLIVMVMIGILAAIAAPSYLSFSNRQKVRTSQSEVYSALRDAQSLARTKNVAYQVNFREKGGVAQYVVIPTATKPTTSTDWDDNTKVFWQDLESGVKITYGGLINTEPSTTPQVRRMAFNASGNYVDNLNTYIKLAPSSGGAGSCVTITTKLGTIRTLDRGESACTFP